MGIDTYMRCQAEVRHDDWRHTQCTNRAKVIRDGTRYCGTHDPVRLDKLRDSNDAKRPRCKNGHYKHQPYWSYCPLCGEKYAAT